MAMAGPDYPTPGVAQFWPPRPEEQGLQALKKQAEYLQQALDGITERIRTVESQNNEQTS